MKRQTIFRGKQAKLNSVKAELQTANARAHPRQQAKWLRSVVSGHIRYYGVPMNSYALSTFRFKVGWLGIGRFRAEAKMAEYLGIGCGA